MLGAAWLTIQYGSIAAPRIAANIASVALKGMPESDMQQGRGGMGSHKHGVSGHAAQSPRLRLGKKLAAERGEHDTAARGRRKPFEFETVEEALKRKPR